MDKKQHIRKLLIANRGEIACRIARTCHDMGIVVVAVYSDADSQALHLDFADEAVHIGGSAATDSYLNGERIIEAAQQTNADAIHPGFGFLAENAAFAQAVIDAGMIWIGPSPEAIAAMGKKRESKLMLKDVPLVPGYEGDAQDDATLIDAANTIGYPIMVKASAGGGGKGMRRVDSADDLPDALSAARREASQAFGDDTLILEKFVQQPRHIEIQVFGDQHGNVIALGERECSIQRRHQKIVEESPSVALDDDLRERISEAACSVGRQLAYVSAGTVEFLLDANGDFYFMEMNTRLQVEHPVTEMVTGLDLVRLQIEVAEGQALPTDVSITGHAIEVRVYAEDPARDFLPATGPVLLWQPPNGDGIRVDDGIRTGNEVTVHYDPMIAKIIAWGKTRREAIRKLDYALSQTVLFGLRHNIGFLRRVLTDDHHVAGDISTQFLAGRDDLASPDGQAPHTALIAAAVAQDSLTAGNDRNGTIWRNNPYRAARHTFVHTDSESVTVDLHRLRDGTITATIGDATHTVKAHSDDTNITLEIDGHRQTATVLQHDATWWIHINGEHHQLDWQTPLPVPGLAVASAGSLRAPMPGQVIAVQVEPGQAVTAGELLMVLEAMKMEHRIEAPHDGIVDAIFFEAGQTVQADSILLEINSDSD